MDALFDSWLIYVSVQIIGGVLLHSHIALFWCTFVRYLIFLVDDDKSPVSGYEWTLTYITVRFRHPCDEIINLQGAT